MFDKIIDMSTSEQIRDGAESLMFFAPSHGLMGQLIGEISV